MDQAMLRIIEGLEKPSADTVMESQPWLYQGGGEWNS